MNDIDKNHDALLDADEDARSASTAGKIGLVGRMRSTFGKMLSNSSADTTDDDEGFEPSARASKLMARYDIDPTPNNYQIWYNYCLKDNDRLNQAIDEIIERDLDFTTEALDEIHDRFFGIEREAVAVFESSRNTEMLISALQDELERTEKTNKTRGKELNAIEKKLESTRTQQDIRDIVTALIDQTRQITLSAGRLEQRLVRSTAELRQLRTNLKESQKDANADSLTGLVNKRYFDFALKDRVRQAKRTGLPFACMLIDIDKLDRINEERGYGCGDLALQDVAKALSDNLKNRDIVARLEDDMFGVLLPDTNMPTAIAMANYLRATVSAKVMAEETKDLPEITMTVSVGAASHKKDEPADRIYSRTTRALEHAKRRGGDQVVSESEVELHGRPKISNPS